MNLTLSSDGNASLPIYNDNGELVGLEVGKVQSLYQVARQAVLEYKVPLTAAITAITAAPAAVLGLKHKGRVAAGMDADLVLLHKTDLTIRDVFAKGRQLVQNGQAIVKGTFEQ
jgi:beta-aspartyl-dipeptidase (metallo-type)